jgi:hypothetical protein
MPTSGVGGAGGCRRRRATAVRRGPSRLHGVLRDGGAFAEQVQIVNPQADRLTPPQARIAQYQHQALVVTRRGGDKELDGRLRLEADGIL